MWELGDILNDIFNDILNDIFNDILNDIFNDILNDIFNDIFNDILNDKVAGSILVWGWEIVFLMLELGERSPVIQDCLLAPKVVWH